MACAEPDLRTLQHTLCSMCLDTKMNLAWACLCMPCSTICSPSQHDRRPQLVCAMGMVLIPSHTAGRPCGPCRGTQTCGRSQTSSCLPDGWRAPHKLPRWACWASFACMASPVHAHTMKGTPQALSRRVLSLQQHDKLWIHHVCLPTWLLVTSAPRLARQCPGDFRDAFVAHAMQLWQQLDSEYTLT